jgi:hypothetical protein
MDNLVDRNGNLDERLAKIESLLAQLVQQRTIKEFYTTAEFAKIVGKAEFTVREWCRFGRIHAKKRACGRGPTQEWMISHDELLRYQNLGLLPVPPTSTKY